MKQRKFELILERTNNLTNHTIDMRAYERIHETDVVTDNENIALQSDIKYRNLE